jgi:hypothetical protein
MASVLGRYVTFQRAHEAEEGPSTTAESGVATRKTAESCQLLLRSRDAHGHKLQLILAQAMSPSCQQWPVVIPSLLQEKASSGSMVRSGEFVRRQIERRMNKRKPGLLFEAVRV